MIFMDLIIEKYLKVHLSPNKQKTILQYILVDKKLKRRFITMAILIRSINNIGYKKKMQEKIKENT